MIDQQSSSPEPTVVCSRKDLRRFGQQLAAMVWGFFFVLPWLRHGKINLWPCWVGLVLAVWSTIAPASLRLLHQGWTLLGRGLGAVNSRIVLALMFFVLITPLGLAMRLFGRDAMGRKWQPAWQTYRIKRPRDAPINMGRLF